MLKTVTTNVLSRLAPRSASLNRGAAAGHCVTLQVAFLLLTCLGGYGNAWAQSGSFATSADKVKVRVIAARRVVRPGSDFPVAVVFEHEPGWHTNPNKLEMPPELGDPSAFVAMQIEVDSRSDGSLKPHTRFIQWPQPKSIEVNFTGNPVPYNVFSGKTVAYLPVTVAPDAPTGPATLTVKVTYQACDDRQCLFPIKDQLVSLTVEISEKAPGTAIDSPPPDGLFEDFSTGVWERIRTGNGPSQSVAFDLFGFGFSLDASSWTGLILLFLAAGLGGLLLNFTPCVLPVIPIKIMSLAQVAESTRRRLVALGLSMCMGIIAFWMALGIAVASLSGLTATNQLFQYPVFTIGIGVFIAIMALGMGGLFSVRLPQVIYRINPKPDSLSGSFMLGIMTAVLSIPCTAPFMGAALGWATLQHVGISLVTFLCIGLGMALPYFVLSARPNLVRSLSRTGPATVLIKQLMGLLLLAVSAYFIGTGIVGLTVSPYEPPNRFYWWPVMSLVAVAGGWLAFKTLRLTKAKGRRIVFCGAGVLISFISLWIAAQLTSSDPIAWAYYTPDRFNQAIRDDKVVVMDFTAEWCLNCKALEESVLRSPRIVNRLNGDGVVPMKVDLTGANPPGKEMLVKQGRLTIPLLVVFDKGGQPVFKSDFYTVEQLDRSIDQALGIRK